MSRHPDKRMLWLRYADPLGVAASTPTEFIEAEPAPAQATELLEAELASEARIFGEVETASGAIWMRPLTFEPDSRGLFKYVLRLRLPPRVDEPAATERGPDEKIAPGTRAGYLFPQGPIGELAALMSLKLQARIFVLTVTNREIGRSGAPSSQVNLEGPTGRVNPRIDPIVFGHSPRTFEDVVALLEQVKRLPQRHHLDMAVSAARYAQALRMVGVDEELVVINLVSAIERLCGDEQVDDDPLVGVKLEDIVRTDRLSPEQVEEVTRLLKHRRLKSRFAAFLVSHCTDFFDGERKGPAHTQVTIENLRSIAKAIYDARSGYLHNGDPMYISAAHPSFPEWQMDPSLGMTWQDRRFEKRQKLPRIDFFHHLVRHCILRHVEVLLSKAG